jgi:hypothetical protein
MKSIKIASVITGVSLLAATLMPGVASAASAAMSLTGATQTNGSFSTVVYENADGPVSSVNLALNFSTAVSNVNYDYSVGPFTATDPSGYHLSQGAQTTAEPVARVTFTLASPGTVTASINTASSVVKGTNADKTAVVNYTVGAASAGFTYTAPAASNPVTTTPGSTTTTTPTAGSSKAATTSTSSSSTTATSGSKSSTTTPATTSDTATAATSTTKKQAAKKTTGKPKQIKSHHTGLVTSSLAALVVVLAGVYWLVIRKRIEVAPVAAPYKLAGTSSKSKAAPKRKASSKSAATKKTK